MNFAAQPSYFLYGGYLAEIIFVHSDFPLATQLVNDCSLFPTESQKISTTFHLHVGKSFAYREKLN